jgi:hypothetical protein
MRVQRGGGGGGRTTLTASIAILCSAVAVQFVEPSCSIPANTSAAASPVPVNVSAIPICSRRSRRRTAPCHPLTDPDFRTDPAPQPGASPRVLASWQRPTLGLGRVTAAFKLVMGRIAETARPVLPHARPVLPRAAHGVGTSPSPARWRGAGPERMGVSRRGPGLHGAAAGSKRVPGRLCGRG